MKTIKMMVFSLLLCGIANAQADAIVMSNNRVISGSVIQTNGDDLLILTPNAAYNFSKASVKGVIAEPAGASSSKERLPDFQTSILLLSKQSWATNLSPIPATVIDKGILRNVPYSSFRCGADYEVNIYGDLDNPAGIEIGVYSKLFNDDSARQNCVNFIKSLLTEAGDKRLLNQLNLAQDLKASGDLTFEITPPAAADSYNGWWISVYSEKRLDQSRASDNEMALISMTKADAEKDANNGTNFVAWSVSELKQARSPAKATISFYNSSGVWITNAEVVRVIDGVSLIWRTGPTSSGMVKLAELPEELQKQFGYDEAKTKAADAVAQRQKAEWQQQVQAAAQAQATMASYDTSSYNYNSYAGNSDYSGSGYSGGRVYVHGYYRKDGTYVHSYTRSAPHR